MARITWAPQAVLDLEDVRRYIARNSEANANAVYEDIYQAATGLSEFPEAGRMVPEFGRQDIRELLVRPYRIIYRLKDDDVEIVMIVHGARRISEADLTQ